MTETAKLSISSGTFLVSALLSLTANSPAQAQGAIGYRCEFFTGQKFNATHDMTTAFSDSIRRCDRLARTENSAPAWLLAAKEPKQVWGASVRLSSLQDYGGSSDMLLNSKDAPRWRVGGKGLAIGSFDALITTTSERYGLDPALVRAVVHVESAGRPHAVSSAGAIGLMQIIPATGARYGVNNSKDLFKPDINIDAGSRYLRDLLYMFRGKVDLAVAAYNAGEGAVIKYGWRTPPYSETQQYVRLVLAKYHEQIGSREKR